MSDVADLDASGLSVYPNPAKDRIHIQLDRSSGGNVRLTNLVGQVLRAERIAFAGVVQFELRDLPAGTYVVEVLEAGKPALRTHVVVL